MPSLKRLANHHKPNPRTQVKKKKKKCCSTDCQQQLTSSLADTKAEQTVQKCGNCGKEDSEEAPLKPCLMCKSVSYCSRDCKKAQTKQHKKVCAAAAQEYAKTAEYKPASRQLPKDSHRGGLQKWQFDT